MTGLDNAYSLYTHCRPIHVHVATGLTWDFCSGHWLSRWCRRINALFHLQAFIVTVTSVSWGRIVWKTQYTLHFRQMSVFRSWKDILCENKKTSQEQKINFFLLYAWDWSNELWTLFSLSADGDRAWKDGLTYKRLSLLGFQEFSSRGVKCLYSAFVDMINCLQKLRLNTNFIYKYKILQGLIWVSSFDFILSAFAFLSSEFGFNTHQESYFVFRVNKRQVVSLGSKVTYMKRSIH